MHEWRERTMLAYTMFHAHVSMYKNKHCMKVCLNIRTLLICCENVPSTEMHFNILRYDSIRFSGLGEHLNLIFYPRFEASCFKAE